MVFLEFQTLTDIILNNKVLLILIPLLRTQQKDIPSHIRILWVRQYLLLHAPGGLIPLFPSQALFGKILQIGHLKPHNHLHVLSSPLYIPPALIPHPILSPSIKSLPQQSPLRKSQCPTPRPQYHRVPLCDSLQLPNFGKVLRQPLDQLYYNSIFLRVTTSHSQLLNNGILIINFPLFTVCFLFLSQLFLIYG